MNFWQALYRWGALGIVLLAVTIPVVAQERRARPPRPNPERYEGVFYKDVVGALQGVRPRVGELAGQQPAGKTSGAGSTASSNSAAASSSGKKWANLTDAVHLEDEIKRLKMRYDAVVTTPGRFNGGDFQQARVELGMLATFFAVINDFEGEIRFREDAAIARDLMSRAIVGVSSGAGDAFNIAKQRQADLQDIVSGSGLNRSAPTEPNDWSIITTRSVIMNYLEEVLGEPLQSGTNNADDFGPASDDLARAAAMVAVLGQVLTEPGMDEADDTDYNAFSRQMTQAALDLRKAIEQQDAEAARLAVGAISQSCEACHNDYR
ncbi:cytochrome c [Planctomycetaceae bacterium SH139]